MREKTVEPDEIGHDSEVSIDGTWHEGMNNGYRPFEPFDEDMSEDERFINTHAPIWANKPRGHLL